MIDLPEPKVMELVLTQELHLAMQSKLSMLAAVHQGTDLRVWVDGMTRAYVAQIETKLKGNMIKETVEGRDTAVVQFPRDWWQHFKQRWFPKRALRRWPVLMQDRKYPVRLDITKEIRVCPHTALTGNRHAHMDFLAGR